MICEHPFALYLGGVEVPVFNKILAQSEGTHVALSFLSLRPRLPKTKPYLLTERYDPKFEVFVDSGGYSAGKRADFDHEEHVALYKSWVEQNIDRISLVAEYDAVALGLDWVKKQRMNFWNTLPAEKFVPVWHEEYGLEELERLCDSYPRVGITKVTHSREEARFRSLKARTEVKFHGCGVASPDVLGTMVYSSAHTIAWIRATKEGSFDVWSAGQLRHYARGKKAETARLTHRADIERAGFDPALVAGGNQDSQNRFGVYVWRQLESHLSARWQHQDAMVSGRRGAEGGLDTATSHPLDPSTLSNTPSETPAVAANSKMLPEQPKRARKLLPGLTFEDGKTTSDQGKRHQIPVLGEEVLRRCDSCSLKSVCPEYAPGESCAFRIPVECRTVEQLQGWSRMRIEMQMQRVLMLRTAEEMMGGAPDAVLSDEMDRLGNYMMQHKQLFDDSFTLSLQVKGGGAPAGIFSSLFGPEIGGQMKELNQAIDPNEADRVIGSFIEGNVVE